MNICGSLPRPPTTTAPMDLEEIPPSSGLRAPDSMIKARPTSVSKIDEFPRSMHGNALPSIEQTPTRGPWKSTNYLQKSVSVMSSIAQTPTRGPTKLTNPLHDAVARKTTEICGLLAPPMFVPQALQLPMQSSDDQSRMLASTSWSSEVHKTPSKEPQSYPTDFEVGECQYETPAKSLRARNESSKITRPEAQETAIKPMEVSLGSTGDSIHNTTSISAREMSPNIYESLGWDDIDELS